MEPAFVIIDMQERFRRWMRAPDLGDAVEVINHVAGLFRAAGHPVVFVQDDESGGPGTPGFEVLAELEVAEGDRRAHKTAANAFRTLSVPGVDFVLLAGFKADGCVLASAKGAEDRDLAHAALRGAVVGSDPETVGFVERTLPLVSYEVIGAILGPNAI